MSPLGNYVYAEEQRTCAHCAASGLTVYVLVAGEGLLCRKCKKDFEGIEPPRNKKGKKK